MRPGADTADAGGATAGRGADSAIASSFGANAGATPDLAWIEGFWRTIEPWVYAREEDDVIIVPPNRVYKANRTAMDLLAFLKRGGRLADIPDLRSKARDIEAFFRDLETASNGGEPALAAVPYDFDYTRLPVLGEIAVTYRCQNRCRFCYAGCGPEGRSDRGGRDLVVSKLKRIIDLFRDEAKIPFFSFTGGEPLLRRDLEILIRHAARRKLRVNLVTNGALATPERARSLKRAGLGSAQVSVESPDPGIHDALCGVPGVWARTIAGVKAFLDAGVPVQTNSTVTKENRESLLELPEFLHGIGVRRFAMNLYIPSKLNPEAESLFVPYSQIGSFIERVKKTARSLGMTFLWYSPVPMCLYNPIAAGLGNKSCAACDGLISVDPEGNVLPCSSCDEPVGNLLSDGFAAAWFSERALYYKRKSYAPDACAGCASFTACQGACPLYWNYAGCAELPRPARDNADTEGGNP